jgi:peroxiredoxin
MKIPRFLTSVDHVVLTLLFVSLAGNVYLGVRLLRPPSVVMRPSGPAVGSTVAAFEAHDLQGRTQVVDARGVGVNTVLYVFSPACGWCNKNLANLRALAAAAGPTYRVIGVSLDPNVDSFVRAHELTFPVLVRPSPRSYAAYGLGATPETIVLSPSGTVLKVWQGAYGGSVAAEVSQFFSIELPGLASNPTTP